MIFHDKDDAATIQLHIKDVREEDAGSYICLAENEAGKAQEKAALTIECKKERVREREREKDRQTVR